MLSPSTFLVLLAAISATFACRFSGMLFTGKLRADHPIIRWSTSVAYAVVMAFTVRILVFPESALQGSSILFRGLALFFAIACFFLSRKNVILACLGGTVLFALLNAYL